MAETATLILQSDKVSAQAVKSLQAKMKAFEAMALARLQAWMLKFDTQDGAFVPGAKAIALLNEIKKELAGVVEMKALTDASKDFLANFDKIADNVRAVHGEENGITVPKSLVTPSKQYAVDQTEFALRQAGVDLKFIEPVRKALFNHINFGAGVKETHDMLRALVTGGANGNGALSQWVGQVAWDAIHQYEGVVNTAIAVDNGLTAVRYVNSLIETSRPQCVRWVGMEYLLEEELASEIEWAKENGNGMIPETTPTTFLIYRGGYRCRHKALPVREEQARKARGNAVPPPKPPKPTPKPKPEPPPPPPPQPTPDELAAQAKAAATAELEALLLKAKDLKAEAEVLAAQAAAVKTKKGQGELKGLAKDINASAAKIVAQSDAAHLKKYHTSGATPDPGITDLLSAVQVTAMWSVPDLLKPVEDLKWIPKTKKVALPKGGMDATGWKKVGDQAGSNVGGLYEAPDGTRWYIKEPPTEAHVRNEVLAAKLYDAVGVRVPQVEFANIGGKRAVASRIVQGEPDPLKVKGGKVEGVLQGFAADVWLANWDTVGSNFDNVIIDTNGHAVRVDMGGSLLYRAQGTPKGQAFGPEAKEFETLRNAYMNAKSAAAFEGLTAKQLKDGVDRIMKFVADYPTLKKMVSTFGPTTELEQSRLIELLQQRANDLQQRATQWIAFAGGRTSSKGSAFDPLKLKYKAKDAKRLLKELEAVQAEALDMFQPKGEQVLRMDAEQSAALLLAIKERDAKLRGLRGLSSEQAHQQMLDRQDVKEVRAYWEKVRSLPEGDAVIAYTGTAYASMNALLYDKRNPGRPNEQTVKRVRDMTKALNEAPPLAKPLVVYRGVSSCTWTQEIHALGEKLVGKIIRTPAFNSTSIHPGNTMGGDVELVITLPKGTKAAYVQSISQHASEVEVIIQRGAMFNVIAVETKAGKTVVYCVLVANGGA